jgi:VanZ family protein
MFSSEHTSRIISPLLRGLLPYATAATLELIHFAIRKSAYFREYFVFSLLLLRAVRGKHRGWMLRWALSALVIAAVISMLDEFHQSFVPSRTASVWDSLLDTFGAAAAQLAVWTWLRSRSTASSPRLSPMKAGAIELRPKKSTATLSATLRRRSTRASSCLRPS